MIVNLLKRKVIDEQKISYFLKLDESQENLSYKLREMNLFMERESGVKIEWEQVLKKEISERNDIID